MDHHLQRCFDQLERSLGAPATARSATMAQLSAAGVDTAGETNLLDVTRHGGEEYLGTFLALAPHDEVALACALVSMRTGLGALARRLVGLGVPEPDAGAVVLWAATEVLSHPVAAPSEASRTKVLEATWTRCRAVARAERRFAARHVSAISFEGAALGSDPAELVSTVLDDAIAAGVLSVSDARLLHATRVLGRPLSDVAAAQRRSRASLDSARRRAERALRGMLQCEGVR